MGENARKRVEDALPLAIDGRMDKAQAAVVTADLFAADPQLEADIELGAALNSDKAERVLYDLLTLIVAEGEAREYWEATTRRMLKEFRAGLAE